MFDARTTTSTYRQYPLQAQHLSYLDTMGDWFRWAKVRSKSRLKSKSSDFAERKTYQIYRLSTESDQS